MIKKNCWEVKKCGRERGGSNQHLGLCPASIEKRLDGVHGGDCAGRACWVVAGVLCAPASRGINAQMHARELTTCVICDFYQMVRREEGMEFEFTGTLLQRLIRNDNRVRDLNVPDMRRRYEKYRGK